MIQKDTLYTRISNMVHRQGNGDIDAAIETLEELSGREAFCQLIDSLMSDNQWIEEVESRSYFHANNFAKIVLLADKEANWKLRLHIWWPQPDQPAGEPEDIHSHRWDFTTALLTGEYLTTEYRLSPLGVDHYQYEYMSAGEDSSFKMKERGKACLTPVLKAHLPKGSVYHITHELLHRVSSPSPCTTATLMIQGPVLSETTRVYSTSPLLKKHEEAIPIVRIGVPDLERQLDRLRGIL